MTLISLNRPVRQRWARTDVAECPRGSTVRPGGSIPRSGDDHRAIGRLLERLGTAAARAAGATAEELQQICRFGAQWVADHAAESDRWAPFHFITQGACIIELSGLGRTIPLSAGDAIVLPHGTTHVLRGPTTPAGARGSFGVHSRPIGSISLKSNTDGEPETQVICGRLRFELAHDNLVLAALPDAIVVSTADDRSGASRLRMLMSAIQEELDGARDGAEAIATGSGAI
jgi:mannose-6-phosphate isomerase-like protein (cupin superfamily)